MAIPPQFRKKNGNGNGAKKVDPKKLEDCVLSLKDQGRPKPVAFAICNARLGKKNNNNNK